MANSKIGGATGSVSDSTRSRNPRPATLNAPRMLTPSEIASLRLNKQETARRVKAVLAAKN
jgi:uncharacterized protein YfaS (alpha-2-macroglobulin family)